MAPFGDHSVLQGLNKDDEKSIRRVMGALIRRIAGVTAAAAAQIAHLHGSERCVVERIFNTAAGNQLLTE